MHSASPEVILTYLCFYVLDMNALQNQYPRLQDFDSSHGNFQLLHPSDVLLHNLPCDMEQDSENGGMEENIVYL